jgi:hypothetical protein
MSDDFINRVVNILKDVNYLDWTFYVGVDDTRTYLQIRFNGIDSYTHQTETQFGRKWMLSPFMTKNEIVQTAFKAIMTAVEHETRENFLYRNRRIFGPHLDVDALWEMSTHIDIRSKKG